jgi:hypothetical protein
MSDYSERELDLITRARQDERDEIMNIIDKFSRDVTLSDGDVIKEVKIPSNHLKSLIKARGATVDALLSGITSSTETNSN